MNTGAIIMKFSASGLISRIPNTITPNSDGYNDCLKVYGLPEGSSFRLFDKQGRLLYSRDPYNPDDCWYGY